MTRFNNHKSRVNARVNLTLDDLLSQHFHGEGHLGLEDMSVQLIDWVKGEKELREKEQWISKLRTLIPHGLNDNDGFMYRIRKHTRAHAHIDFYFLSALSFNGLSSNW